jgi:hypothetical protein
MTSQEKSPVCGGAYKSSLYTKNSTKKKHEKQTFSFAAVNESALSVLPLIILRWIPGGVMHGCEYVVRNPKRADNRAGSFKINTRTGRWSDFASGDKGGDVISLAAYLFNISQNDAKERLAEMLGVKS